MKARYWDFTLLCLASLVLFAFTVWKDSNREWKKYQKAYYQMEFSRLKARGESGSIGKLNYAIKQNMVPGTEIIDRCITCHQGFDNTESGYKLNPYKVHPNPDQHSQDKFGCAVCHRGQGLATTTEDAHGYHENWNFPILKGEYIQASCGQCHQDQELVKDAPLLLKGKELFSEYECLGCHSLNGKGGKDAPDLTTAGDKKKGELDFGKYDKTRLTQADWQFMHMKNPKVFDQGSEMPDLGLSDEDARALAIYILSLSKKKVAENLLYVKTP